MKNRISIRVRLIISFCIILFVPFFLGSFVLAAYHQMVELQVVEDNLGNNYNYLSESAEIISKYVEESGPIIAVYRTIMSTEIPMPVRRIVFDLIISVAIILIFTATILILWIYQGIVPELKYLINAADRIKEGQLEEPIRVRGTNEIAALSRALEEMRKRLQANAKEKIISEEEQKQLISNIAHDLKTPITAIKGYSEGLIDGVANTKEKQDSYIKTIYNKAEDMNVLINELSLYSKLDTNRIPYNFQHINLDNYFMDIAEEIGLDLENQQVEFSYYNYAAKDVEIIADPEQLGRVVHNIVSNSVKYKGDEPLFIKLRISDVGDFVQVEITDNGKGIATDDLPRIFDRMFRADTSRNSTIGGSGIGLSIVKKIVEDHGGNIWVNSKLGEGTSMYFVIRKYEGATLNE